MLLQAIALCRLRFLLRVVVVVLALPPQGAMACAAGVGAHHVCLPKRACAIQRVPTTGFGITRIYMKR